ncbi:protein phosphatase CheZ [Caldovatus aquaticus]|uniref:Protein phosphatase CheZ n=1 Tax=Caldovatus aquaticus TaxID=2865671 RepID=A0ABS7F2V5_9PROT|nr:protein phosphatase CheZ [Caldovatus aquaticus]MBW8269824.1 protein phosphatase CheZ [Caldovatus aquaticus]
MPDGLRGRGASAAAAPPPPPSAEAIEAAVRAVLGSLEGDLTAKEAALLAELEALGRTVRRVKAEIAALGVEDITASHIPSATDELDAVVEHTAAATNEILDCCETLERLEPQLGGEGQAALRGAITRIYEACSFQDITGQRIAKVVAALKAIEARVAAVVGTVARVAPAADAGGAAASPAEAAAGARPPPTEGQALAQGPQLPGAGVSQDEIDRLLASFD